MTGGQCKPPMARKKRPIGPGFTRLALIPGVALGVLMALSAGTAAQAVEGTLLHEDTGLPLPGAPLYLMDHDGEVADSARTDQHGRFRLAPPRAGTYNLLFQMDGWTNVPSEQFQLTTSRTHHLDFTVPLISLSALEQMGDLMRMETELAQALPEICGEAFRPWEAGLLIGVVRNRSDRQPLPGATVTVATGTGQTARSTISNARGTYILCNVPTGPDVHIIIKTPDGTTETTDVEIRAGTASWYDLPVGPRRPTR